MTDTHPHLWVDADACPVAVRKVLFKAARRTGRPLTLVANQYLSTPAARNIRAVQVAAGFDAADDYIEAHCAAGDLVITQDIPLAAKVVERGATALSPRGVLFDAETVKSHLARRNLMEELRGAGMISGGPAALGAADVHQFASRLDTLLARLGPPVEPGASEQAQDP
ncbi:MAG: YaiI/YqxD family protein [Pseudomonadota bacterium]